MRRVGKEESITISRDTNYIGREWNDKTLSLIVRDVINKNSKVTLWQHAPYKGSCVLLSVGKHDIQDLQLMNDRISSVEVPQGIMAILYEHSEFGGKLQGFDTSVPNVGGRIADKTSSVSVVTEAPYTYLLRNSQARAGMIGQPPRLESYDPTSAQSAPILIGEVLIPFIYVTDPRYPPEAQAERSPYYLLSRWQFWERIQYYDHPGGVPERTYKITRKKGVSQDVQKSIKTTLQWEISGEGKFSFSKVISADIKSRIQRTIEVTESETQKEFEEVAVEDNLTISSGKPRVALQWWGMRDLFQLQSVEHAIKGDRNTYIAKWQVPLDNTKLDAYPQMPG